MNVHALTLGRIQGAALIGRPLDVSVQVQLDPNQSIANACFEADVFHADTRQNPAGVRVRLEPIASMQGGARLRITSSSVVDEPVVTVYVRAGCVQMSSRRYVLLADIVSEQAEPMPRVTTAPLVEASRLSALSEPAAGGSTFDAVPVAAAAVAGSSDAGGRPAAGSRPRAQPERRAAPVRAARAAPPRAPRADNAALAGATARQSGSGQSRLTLDPLEVLSDRVATLESSATAVPAQTSEREAREIERLERLEASVKALLELARKNEASLLDVRSRLEKAQADRVGNALTYVLFGLLLLSLLAIAYLLARMGRAPQASGSRWFEAAPGASGPDSEPPAPGARSMTAAAPQTGSTGVSAPAPLVDAGPAVLATTAMAQTERLPIQPTRPMAHDGAAPASGVGHAQVDVSLVEMSESTFGRLMQSGSAQAAIRPARATVPIAAAGETQARSEAPPVQQWRINADELIDIRQRAEFFVTLGQTDQAVQVLEARIAQDGASCPQIYLDLFKLFHSLGLKADFDLLHDDFVALFNVRMPEFGDFDEEGRSLEDYPGAVDRLIRVWNRVTALDTLEQMVYRRQGEDADAGADALDLAAFRDLLMLHAVAQTVHLGAAMHAGSFAAPDTTRGQGGVLDIDLSALIAPEDAPNLVMPRGEAPARAEPPARMDVGVHVDVDVPVGGTGVTDAATASSPRNLIDFDLSSIDFVTQPGKDS